MLIRYELLGGAEPYPAPAVAHGRCWKIGVWSMHHTVSSQAITNIGGQGDGLVPGSPTDWCLACPICLCLACGYKSRIKLHGILQLAFFNLIVDHEHPCRSLDKDPTLSFSYNYFMYAHTHLYRFLDQWGYIIPVQVSPPSSRVRRKSSPTKCKVSILNRGLANPTSSWAWDWEHQVLS